MSEEYNPQDVIARMAGRNRVLNDQANALKNMIKVEAKWLGVLNASSAGGPGCYDVAFVSGKSMDIDIAVKLHVDAGVVVGSKLSPAYFLKDIPIVDPTRLFLRIAEDLANLKIHLERHISVNWNLGDARDYTKIYRDNFLPLGDVLSDASHLYRQIRIREHLESRHD